MDHKIFRLLSMCLVLVVAVLAILSRDAQLAQREEVRTINFASPTSIDWQSK